MNDEITRAELAQLRARVAQLETKQRPRSRLRQLRRFLPLAVIGLLVALMPLSLLAATPFLDLDQTQNGPTGHNPNIDAIFNAGITKGCTATEYCPKDVVTREQMASFLARTAGLGGNSPVVNAATAVNATNATNATQLGGVAAANYVQTNSKLLPIAYGTVNDAGTKLSGTANVSVTKTAVGRYSITITGENYFFANYTTAATLIGGGGEISTDSLGGNLRVRTSDSAGAAADSIFQFVVFKP